MIRQLTKCIREYKAPTIWTLVLILAEVAIDVIIPFETANLINEVKAGAELGGIVRVAARMGGYGNCVVVRHPNGLETLYGHLSKINVQPHQQVEAGEVLGLGGNTGNSTGPHLHFECRFLYQTFDPEWILDFDNYTLRTRRLHLNKSYFGIRKPGAGQESHHKPDASQIKEMPKGKRRPATTTNTYNIKDF